MYNNLTHEQTRVVIVKCISFWYIHVLIDLIHSGCAHYMIAIKSLKKGTPNK